MTKKEYKESLEAGLHPYIVEPLTIHRENCCDCGLSHRIIYDVDKKGRILRSVYRDEHHTDEIRRVMPTDGIKWIIKTLQAELKRRGRKGDGSGNKKGG